MNKKSNIQCNESNSLDANNLETDSFDPVEFQAARQIQIFKFTCFFGVVYLTLFSMVAYFDHRRLVAVIDLAMVVVLAAIIVWIQTAKRVSPNKLSFIAVLGTGLFFLFLFFSRQMEGLGFLWYFTYPLLAFFLLGTHRGTAMSAMLIGATLLILLFTGKSYSPYFLVRFLGAYIAVSILSFFFEQVRANTENRLLLNYKRLNAMLNDLSMAQHALRDSHKRYQDLVETVNDWIWEVNEHGRLVYSSPQIQNILEYRPEEIIGKTFVDMAPENLKDKTEQFLKKLKMEKKGIVGMEVKLMHRSGNGIILETNAIPILDKEDRLIGFRGVTRDITMRKEAQEEQAELKKLQGALELAGAICHELNQPMMAVNGYAELLLSNEGLDASIAGPLEKIRRQTGRMGTITRKLMSITRYETRDYTGGKTIMDIDRSSKIG